MPTRIKVDSKNRLIITEASADKEGKLTKIITEGKWSLSKDHSLKLKISGNRDPYAGKTLIFNGSISKVTGDSLAFRVRGSENIAGLRTSTIELKGIWQADTSNRLTFSVSKYRGTYDILRFQGAWDVNRNNELVYKYEQTALKTRRKTLNTLVFKGFWEIDESRLVYALQGDDNSFFSFKAALQSRNLIASQGKIKYQIGVKFSSGTVYREVVRTVTIFGKWKLGKDLGVSFDIESSGRKKQSIVFSAEKVIGEGANIKISLKSKKGEKLGIELAFSKKIIEDIELFAELSRLSTESRALVGVRAKF